MLVLTRRSGESVHVGDDVVVTVLDVRGEVVRLGIQAPRTIQVHREEIYRELQAANRAAASPSADALRNLARLVREPKAAPPANPGAAPKPGPPPGPKPGPPPGRRPRPGR